MEFALGTGIAVAPAKPALRSTISAGQHGFFSTMTAVRLATQNITAATKEEEKKKTNNSVFLWISRLP